MKKLSIIVDFNNKNLIWYNVIVPMWTTGSNLPKTTVIRSKTNQVMPQTSETKVTREATERTVKIIDIKYEKSNLEEIYQSAHQLDTKEQVMFLHLIKDFEELFYLTLGKWNTGPVEIKLKPDDKTLSSRYYLVHHIKK